MTFGKRRDDLPRRAHRDEGGRYHDKITITVSSYFRERFDFLPFRTIRKLGKGREEKIQKK